MTFRKEGGELLGDFELIKCCKHLSGVIGIGCIWRMNKKKYSMFSKLVIDKWLMMMVKLKAWRGNKVELFTWKEGIRIVIGCELFI
jgi:hypothetical protein